MSKQTSIDWLIEQLTSNGVSFLSEELEMIKQAKAMHKEEIVDTHAVGRIKQCAGVLTDGYEYYNKEFGGNE